VLTLGIALTVLPTISYGQVQEQIQLANEYLAKGDKKKAAELYRDLAKNDVNTSFIYNNYVNVLLDLGLYDEAQNFLKKVSRHDPQNLQFRLDFGLTYIKAGDMTKADKYFKELIAENKGNMQRIKVMSDYFMSRSLPDYGIIALTESRQVLGNPYLFCLDLAMLYRVKGTRTKWFRNT
jgi:tetratricopeptide (TPR) repeat protein